MTQNGWTENDGFLYADCLKCNDRTVHIVLKPKEGFPPYECVQCTFNWERVESEGR